MSSNDILSVLEDIIEGRNHFLSSEIIRALPFQERSAVLNRYMSNELIYMDLLNRVYSRRSLTDAATTLLTFTLPSGFMDPVPVVPSVARVTASLEDRLSMTGDCAICQDAISGAGSRIRQCGHSFHRGCIVNWFSMSARCPVCRHDIREDGPPAGTPPASS